MTHVTTAIIEKQLPYVEASPKDNGVIKLIVVRPKTNKRQILDSCFISYEKGMEGDNWTLGCWKTTEDGSPHPDVQIAITNYRIHEIFSNLDKDRALAGDNLFVDLDLSERNLKAGDRLALGSAIIKITSVPHNGCGKFKERFGIDALKFVNSPIGKQMHLRGIYAKVIQNGIVSVNDTIKKIEVT